MRFIPEKRDPKVMKANSMREEAAHYALLCRIAPALRHRLVGRLHPIGLTAAVAGRQLTTDRLNLAGARESIAKVQLQAREAIVSTIATLAWITGEEAASVALQPGVDMCVALVRTDCEMRGVAISSKIAETDILVPQRALRIVLTACLIALVDRQPQLSRIELRSALSEDTIEIHFDLNCAETTQDPSSVTERRPLKWDDVEALADHEGVEVFSSGKPPRVKCRFSAIVAETRSAPGKSALVLLP